MINHITRAKIYANRILIGIVDLQIGDKSMGHVYGSLIPNDYYYKNIQKQAWKVFPETGGLDYSQLEPLQLQAELENGYPLNPQGGITIDDCWEFPDDGIHIDIVGIDPSKITDQI